VEFAKAELEQGKTVMEAALTAARLRLRPILMTAFAFILGVVPLILSSGAGAHARVLLGLTVFGGMTAASLIGIFLIPVSFYVVETLTRRKTSLLRPARQEYEPLELGPQPDMHQTSVATVHSRIEGGS
jgi:HAE1 family hydrophobic/amphiphilic exporter-1